MPDDDKSLIVKLGALIDELRETVGELKDWSPVVREFAQDAFGPAVRESGLLAGDVVGIVRTPFTWFRLKCLGAILKQARDLVGDAEVQPLPTGYAVCMLDAMKDVDEPTLQEMWARLLAGAVRGGPQSPLFVETLRRMSSFDAGIFNRVVAAPTKGVGLARARVIEGDLATEESLDRLEVLGVAQRTNVLTHGAPFRSIAVDVLPLGRQLHAALTACEGESAHDQAP